MASRQTNELDCIRHNLGGVNDQNNTVNTCQCLMIGQPKVGIKASNLDAYHPQVIGGVGEGGGGVGKLRLRAVTSNVRPLACPIICTDI